MNYVRWTHLRFGCDQGDSHGYDDIRLSAKLVSSKMEFVVLFCLIYLINNQK